MTKKLSKAIYFNNEFYKNKGDIKGTWEVINRNIKRKAKSSNVIIKENDVIVNQKDVPNKFINYFTDIPLKVVSRISPVNINASFFLKDKSSSSFFYGSNN